MCGIVGYTGPREAYPIIIKGLQRLEYRGYDSTGVALLNGGLNVYMKIFMQILALVIPDGPHMANQVIATHTLIHLRVVNWQ